MIYYSKTDKGKIRDQNEDYIYAPHDDGGYFAVVADGMGGHQAGEVASRLVVDTIIDSLKSLSPVSITEEIIINALISANKNVWDEAHADEQKKGMGSTATVAVFNGPHMIIGHVGDSRAYLYRNGLLSQITKDHSYVQMLIDSGYITEKEAQRHPAKNIITRAVGIDENIDVDIYSVLLNQGDIILLCSDGLNCVVSNEEIESTLNQDAASAVDALIESALKHGGYDNISVVLAYMDGDGV